MRCAKSGDARDVGGRKACAVVEAKFEGRYVGLRFVVFLLSGEAYSMRFTVSRGRCSCVEFSDGMASAWVETGSGQRTETYGLPWMVIERRVCLEA